MPVLAVTAARAPGCWRSVRCIFIAPPQGMAKDDRLAVVLVEQHRQAVDEFGSQPASRALGERMGSRGAPRRASGLSSAALPAARSIMSRASRQSSAPCSRLLS